MLKTNAKFLRCHETDAEKCLQILAALKGLSKNMGLRSLRIFKKIIVKLEALLNLCKYEVYFHSNLSIKTCFSGGSMCHFFFAVVHEEPTFCSV